MSRATAARTEGAKGAVACGHEETAAAASEILAEGGNAFDAALAAMCAAFVVGFYFLFAQLLLVPLPVGSLFE